MNCPICQKQLLESDYLACPDKHGVLVTGKFLTDIEKAALPSDTSAGANTKHLVSCPHCNNQMQKVDYNHTGIIIDVCTNCHYRWLDAGEIHKIKNHKPDFKPQDLLFLVNFDDQARTAAKENTDPVNPKIPLFNLQRIISTGDSKRTMGALAGMGLYGIITGMLRSKFLRVVIPLMLIFFGLFYYFVIRYFR